MKNTVSEIEDCALALTEMVQQYHDALEDPERNNPRLVKAHREAIQQKWDEYLLLTAGKPDDIIESRVRTVAYLNLV